MTIFVQDLSECSLLHCVTPAPLEFGDDEPLQETKSVKPKFLLSHGVVVMILMMMMLCEIFQLLILKKKGKFLKEKSLQILMSH